MNALIFAGGSGTRLWPASTKNKPKQFLNFFGDLTMLEKTHQRINKIIPNEKIFIATSEFYSYEIKNQLQGVPDSNFLFEPVRKNRGPALGLLMLFLKQYSPDPYFTTVWSDDHINQEEIYHNSLASLEKHLDSNPSDIIAIGVSPTNPDVSFRYVQVDSAPVDSLTTIYNVSGFVDKPDLDNAKKIFSSGRHFWNTGYFISSVDAILNLYKKEFPQCYAILEKIQPFMGTDKESEVIAEYYHQMPSFDFEEIFFVKPELLKLAPATFDWMDIGKWDAVKDIQSESSENLTKGLTVTHGTDSSLIYNYNPNQLVSALHVDNMIIVVTPESILVAKKDKVGDLKKIIEQMEDNEELKKFL